MRKAFLPLAIVAAGAGFGAALAQATPPDGWGIDIAAIQARADEQAAEAETLTAEVSRRAEEYRVDAEAVRAASAEQLKGLDGVQLAAGPAGAVDFDEMIAAAAGNMRDNRGSAPQFMVFVSLSMPEASLKRIIRETAAVGGFVVFRGFPNNSAKQFLAGVTKVVEKDDAYANIGIDPRLFRAFDVQAVPTYVAVSSDFSPCDGLTCTTTPPPYDAMAGNVSVGYALQAFADGNGPGALVARGALKQLADGAP